MAHPMRFGTRSLLFCSDQYHHLWPDSRDPLRWRACDRAAGNRPSGQRRDRSIAGDGGVDHPAPQIDSSGHTQCIGKSILLKPSRSSERSSTVMAVDHQPLALHVGYDPRLGRPGTERHQLRPRDAAHLEFLRLTTIEQKNGDSSVIAPLIEPTAHRRYIRLHPRIPCC